MDWLIAAIMGLVVVVLMVVPFRRTRAENEVDKQRDIAAATSRQYTQPGDGHSGGGESGGGGGQ